MDVRLREMAARQDDLLTAWQLLGAGWTVKAIRHGVEHHGWRRVHQGVFVVNHAPLTQRQRWLAAALTAPETWLNAASAGSCWGFWPWEGPFETVVRAGSGGPRRFGPLLVARSTTLAGHITLHDGIPIVTAARALADLAPHLDRFRLGRGFRESIRLKTTTANDIAQTCRALRGGRGTASLAALCDRYAAIPYHRCKSDAESRALEILHDAGVTPPEVNVDVAGREADLVWRRWQLLIEIDGREFHQFTDQDRIKQARWESAGFNVRRVPASDVYFHPERLLAHVNVRMYRS